ncbi:MAG: phosphatase PAP2 family protein [Chitinophagaceae bacterium]|mgnify:FL=1|nr:phosphatase PAP2 family protein [Chitinophagaceae bacterium]
MQKISIALNQNKIYFAGFSAILFAAILFLLVNGKEAAFISLNSYHPFYLNVFFINYTFMGDGIFAVCLTALMFFYFKRKQAGFALLYSFLISGLAAQLLKNLFNSPRPKLYFEAGTYLNFIDGVTLSGSSSFPSGHTATAFAIAAVLVLMMKNKNWQLLVLLAAILVGYSRIYLAQHFLLDVIVGALLGTVSGILAFYLAQNRISIRKSIKRMHQVPAELAPPAAMQAS